MWHYRADIRIFYMLNSTSPHSFNPVCRTDKPRRSWILTGTSSSQLYFPTLLLLLLFSPTTHTHIFSSSSITSHLVSISQGPLSELPADYLSSMWARGKSLERSKPFISVGGGGWFHLCSAGCSVFGTRVCGIVIAVVSTLLVEEVAPRN